MYSAHCNTAKASATLKFWSTASTRDSPPPRRSGALTSALLSDLGVSALSILLAARLSAAPDTPLPTNGEASLRSPLQNSDRLFMAGVRDSGHEVGAAVRHCGACVFRAIRRSPLGHRRVDSCRPFVDALGIGIVDDDAARGRRRGVDVLLVDAPIGSHALLELFVERRHQEFLEHCGVSVRLIGLRHGADH